MKSQRKFRENENIKEFLANVWGNSKPVCKLFRTSKSGYLYDTGTNKILGCTNNEYDLLDRLFVMPVAEAVDKSILELGEKKFKKLSESLTNIIKTENILLTKRATKFGRGTHFFGLEEAIGHKLQMIQLEVTEKCNLRCKYCVYDTQNLAKRNHSNQDMSLRIGFAAIDYLAKHSIDNDTVHITFYGGEPLICFPFIDSCVKYAQNTIDNKTLHLSLTTNGTLMTREIATFLHQNSFSVVVSLDGPREIHDAYRNYANGTGSYDKTVRGLNILLNAYADTPESLSLSMVYAPPYYDNKLERISELWQEFPLLPRNMQINVTYPVQGTTIFDRLTREDVRESKPLYDWMKEKYLMPNNLEINPIAKSLVDKKLASLYHRNIFNRPVEKYFLNGCCVPAMRKMFVTSKGNIQLCERLDSGEPIIGNVFRGLDLDKIKKMCVDEYANESIRFCNSCWAIQICKICYVDTFSGGVLDMQKKEQRCADFVRSELEYIKLYCEILEKDPNGLDHLEKYVLQ